ncbi:hypothetical protein AB0J17_41030, partial [Streptomyces sp. NPDC049949]
MNAPDTGPDTAPDTARSDARTVAALDVVVHHYEPVKAPLLREAVLPLARRAAADGLTVHVERHWLHGPHLRLRLRGRPDAVAGAAGRRPPRRRPAPRCGRPLPGEPPPAYRRPGGGQERRS